MVERRLKKRFLLSSCLFKENYSSLSLNVGYKRKVSYVYCVFCIHIRICSIWMTMTINTSLLDPTPLYSRSLCVEAHCVIVQIFSHLQLWLWPFVLGSLGNRIKWFVWTEIESITVKNQFRTTSRLIRV